MSRDAEAEALAMDYSVGAFNAGADSRVAPDVQPEALAMGAEAAPHVHSEAMAFSAPPPSAAVSKSNLPVLDLLHWSETPYPNPNRARSSATNDSSAFMNASDESPLIQLPMVRTSQPAGGISTISFGNLTLEESDQLQKRRPGSDSKRREMIGSRIFDKDLTSGPAPDLLAKNTLPAGLVTSVRSTSSANTEDSALSPKRPVSLSEMAKQRELSGTIYGAGRDIPNSRRPNSSAKSKELEGSNIFGRSSQYQLNTITPKCLANDLNNYRENNAPPRTSVKVSNPAGGRSQIVFGGDGVQQNGAQGKKQGHNQKATELAHDIVKDEAGLAINNNINNHNERIVSAAKRREMIGNDIFSDSNPTNLDHPRRARQPPGGESNLKLC